MVADGVLAASALFANANSNDAKMRLLERRLRGDTPSPRNLSRGISPGQVRALACAQRWTVFPQYLESRLPRCTSGKHNQAWERWPRHYRVSSKEPC